MVKCDSKGCENYGLNHLDSIDINLCDYHLKISGLSQKNVKVKQ